MLPGRPERAPRDNYHHGLALRTSSCPAESSAVGQQAGLGGLRILPVGQMTCRASRSFAPSRHQHHQGSALNGWSRPSRQARSALPHPPWSRLPSRGGRISFRRPPQFGILQSDRRMAGDPMRAALSSTTWVRRPAKSSTISFFWPAIGQPVNIEGRLDSVKCNVAIAPTLASGGRDHCLSAVALPTLREAVGASIKYRDG